MEDNNGIPKFDLAEQIMAEHRKNASVRRKGPSRSVQPQEQARKVEVSCYAARPPLAYIGQEQVIAEIVARDIERLCRTSA